MTADAGAVLLQLLAALAVIVPAIGVAGAASRRLGQPAVVGELIGGLLLGPSLLGWLAPQLAAVLLPPSIHGLLALLGSLGVVLYMFLVGLELDVQELRRSARTTVLVSQAGMVIPLLLGVLLGIWLFGAYAPPGPSRLVFALFLGVSLSVTAFPVLARILTDRGMQRTSLGITALSAAAVQDAMAWCLLAVVVGLAQSAAGGGLLTIALTAGFVLALVAWVRPAARRLLTGVRHRRAVALASVALLGGLAVSAATTEAIGVHAVFGAFLFGVVIPHEGPVAAALRHRIHGLALMVLLPVFFVSLGTRIDLLAIGGPASWSVLAAILLAACAGKIGGTMIGARLTGLGWRDAATLGALMNTRGLVELIVLDVGLRLGILSPPLFAMLVVTALVTTFMTGPLLRLFRPPVAAPATPLHLTH